AERRSRIIERLRLTPKGYALATIHRAANTDDAQTLSGIFAALADLASEMPVVFPLHPRTHAIVDAQAQELFGTAGGILTKPVGYLDMLLLERHAALVVTDSGGVQKEAFYNEVPCITLREETEWPELISLGWNTLLAPSQAHQLRNRAHEVLEVRGEKA